MHETPRFEAPRSKRNDRTSGFTLIEVILVMVVIVIISAITLPHFSSSFKGNKLRTSARTISRMSRYARSMAIMREEMLTLALNPETLEIYLGANKKIAHSTSDGELDQEVFVNLGWRDDAEGSEKAGDIEKEVHRFLPEGLLIKDFEKDETEDDDTFAPLYRIRYYPNGQCERFEMEIEDTRGIRIRLENDPISGKIKSEFLQ